MHPWFRKRYDFRKGVVEYNTRCEDIRSETEKNCILNKYSKHRELQFIVNLFVSVPRMAPPPLKVSALRFRAAFSVLFSLTVLDSETGEAGTFQSAICATY
jgi:hypothetical protein